MKPVRIKRESESVITMKWDDGHAGRHTVQSLRAHCPCATCRTARDAHEATVMLPILVPGKNELKAIEPVGNYALQLVWGDGHQTGIYTYEYLREICECGECSRMGSE
jgi:DUF971 family protein